MSHLPAALTYVGKDALLIEKKSQALRESGGGSIMTNDSVLNKTGNSRT